jgi:hypothetical protein
MIPWKDRRSRSTGWVEFDDIDGSHRASRELGGNSLQPKRAGPND